MNQKRHKLRATLTAGAAIVGLVALTTLKAGATPITILNSDFSLSNPNTGKATDWTGGGFGDLTNNPNYLNTTTGYGTSGTTFGEVYANAGVNYTDQSLDQITTATVNELDSPVVTGDTLTLSVAVGQLFGTTQEDYVGAVNLLIGGNIVDSDYTLDEVPTLVTKGFAKVTLDYTVQAGDSGAIEIDLTSPNPNDESGNDSRRFYNNVTLDVESAPEPSAWAMLLTGLASLLGLQRFRRRT